MCRCFDSTRLHSGSTPHPLTLLCHTSRRVRLTERYAPPRPTDPHALIPAPCALTAITAIAPDIIRAIGRVTDLTIDLTTDQAIIPVTTPVIIRATDQTSVPVATVRPVREATYMLSALIITIAIRATDLHAPVVAIGEHPCPVLTASTIGCHRCLDM